MKKLFKKIGIFAMALALMAQPVMAAPDESPEMAKVTAFDDYGTECNFKLRLTGFTPEAGEIIMAAVWSEKDGQDDIIWYKMNAAETGYEADVSIADHKTAGNYFVHVYTGVKGKEKFVTKTDFSVSEASASAVYPENVSNSGTCDIKAVDVSAKTPDKQVVFDVWSEADRKDLYTYKAQTLDGVNYEGSMNIANHGYNIGTYNIQAKVIAGNGVTTVVGNATVEFKSNQATVTQVHSGSSRKVSVSDINVPGGLKNVKYYIWSEKNGQDDIKVYTEKYVSDGTSSLKYPDSDFSTPGKYLIHVYGTTNGGKQVFLGLAQYNVAGPSAEDITADNNNLTGSFEVRIKGLTSDLAVTQIKVPVWSKADQSDLYWYTATKDTDGSYVVNGNISNHKYNLGKYYVDVYAATKGGSFYVDGRTMTFKIEGDPVVKESSASNKRKISVTNINIPGGLKNVRYAVWSSQGGQDDLKWYTASYSGTSRSSHVYYSDSDFHTFGKYLVHVYGTNSAGQSVYIGQTSYTIAPPSAESVKVVSNNAAGTFNITVKGVTASSEISQVKAAVWCASDQSDLKWYTLKKNSSGDYVNAEACTIANHKYSLGQYKVHVYAWDVNNYSGFIGQDNMTFAIKYSDIDVSGGENEKLYAITVKGLEVPGGCKKVTIPTWSDAKGQDDIIWYSTTRSGSDYTASVNIANHKTAGQYTAHVYAQLQNGKMAYVGLTKKLTVDPKFTASVAAGNANDAAGTFDIYVKLESQSSNITGISIPVWCAANQSDIKWYNAVKQSDGTYKITVDVANHKNNLGEYTAHVYATFENGIKKGISGTKYTFNPPNFLSVLTTAANTKTITLKNAPAGASAVKFAVWSLTKGQDDITWLEAKKQADGSWAASTKTSVFKHAGTCMIHCFVDGEYVTKRQFTLQESELIKNGWYYEGGYKFYYVNGKKQTDVRGIVPVTKGYRAEVNRKCCTVTIYTYDWEKSDSTGIVPVCSFACSVGLPATPTPAGRFYTLAKFRWKELMGPSYGQYVTRVTNNGIYFHSVAGYNTTPYNLSAVDYNMLGSPASHGCIRLCVRDAKWIYDNCALGMQVDIYDSASPGPMGKPATIKIPSGQTWDPTDPNI